ncbi:FadR/GntR family transcriptional regulator [Aquiluna sp. Uisw_065]|uniref:FadR/GntR family transcriptional regulator n=1 Tax=Aquiluna sp. Uisw_065 TaxID=3230967 RepID=UPI0039EBE119
MSSPTKSVAPESEALTSSSKDGGQDLREQVIETLGLEICGNNISPGATFSTESIEARFQVSRPVVREALRGLEALGLVKPRRRVGMTVMPLTEWNVYDLQVIRWRLAGASRVAQLRSLTELRRAIEPSAAEMAAIRTPLGLASELVGLSGELWKAGKEGDSEEFLRVDRRFHTLVLEMSGNEMFAKLHHLVDEVLVGRTYYGLMPRFPAIEALQLHTDIAIAIQSGNPKKASASMLAVMERTIQEMSTIWDLALDPEDHRPRSSEKTETASIRLPNKDHG